MMMTNGTAPSPLPPAPAVATQAEPLAKASFWLICVTLLLWIPFIPKVLGPFPPPKPATWEIVLAYFVLLPLPPLLYLAVRLYRLGPAPVSPFLLLAGIAFLLLGAAVDIIATVVNSPDLRHEANPIARTLLDSGLPLGWVYAYGGIATAMGLAILSYWWAGFLAHYRTLLDWAWASRPQSYLEFVRATAGWLTWRQLLFPMSLSDLVAVYRACYYWFFQTFSLIAFALTLPRFYIALVWFQMVPFVHVYTLYLLSVAVVLPLYMLWLYWEYKIHPPATLPEVSAVVPASAESAHPAI
jgi:hypothetical protein